MAGARLAVALLSGEGTLSIPQPAQGGRRGQEGVLVGPAWCMLTPPAPHPLPAWGLQTTTRGRMDGEEADPAEDGQG